MRFLPASALVLASVLTARAADPWPVPVKDFAPPKPGEHPRLFFRKADLPELRKRAETPEGKQIVARLKELVGGGDRMPTEFNPNRGKQKDGSGDFHAKAPDGQTYTLWHGAGFGMLYQLTGEKKYADLGRECVAKALDGQRDRDNRYSFRDPTGALRAGPSLGAVAMAYDLCHDGWDAAFRKTVCEALANYNEGQYMSLAELARGSRHNPQSNHWGCQIGGAALALLAVKGDDGADPKKVDELLAAAEKSFVRNLTEGFGDGGYFHEHAGPGQISSDTAFVPAVQTFRVAGGKDFATGKPNASAVTLIRCYEATAVGGKPRYMLRHPSTYGTGDLTPDGDRKGLSRGGQFAQGFGAVDPKYRPGVLWVYNHVVEPDPAKRTFDGVSPYPHRPVLALVNWPIGEAEKNPAEVFPKIHHDSLKHYAVFRNRWKDENDVLVSALFGARAEKGKRDPVMVWAFGQAVEWGNCPKQATSKVVGGQPDGSGVLVAGVVNLGVDFSGASGADVLIVAVGPGMGGAVKGGEKFKSASVKAGATTYHVLTASAGGKHPEPKADGDALVVGGRRAELKDGVLVFGK